MTVFYEKARAKWRYDFTSGGRRYRGYCIDDAGVTAKNRKEALAAEAVAKAAVTRAIKGTVRLNNLPLEHTLAEAIAFYLKQMHGRSIFNNLALYARECLTWFGPAATLRTVIDRQDDFVVWLAAQPKRRYKGGNSRKQDAVHIYTFDTLSKASVNKRVWFLKHTLATFRDAPVNRNIRHLIPESPPLKCLKTERRAPTPFSADAVATVLNALKGIKHRHVRQAFLLCLNTGMRQGEIAQIRTRQYQRQEKTILLEAIQTKTNAAGYIYLNNTADRVIAECMDIGNDLWSRLLGDPILAQEYKKKYGIHLRGDIPLILYCAKDRDIPRPISRVTGSAWHKLKKRHNIDFRWHDTRAAFCSNLLASGVDVRTVQELARHQSLQSTTFYLKAGDPAKRKAVLMLENEKSPTEVTHKYQAEEIEKV